MPRFKRRLGVRYSSDGKTWHTTFSHDIGPWGLFLVARNALKAGTAVRLSVELPGHGSLAMGGRVMWEKPGTTNLQSVHHGGFGVSIDHAPEAWYRFVESLAAGTDAG